MSVRDDSIDRAEQWHSEAGSNMGGRDEMERPGQRCHQMQLQLDYPISYTVPYYTRGCVEVRWCSN